MIIPEGVFERETVYAQSPFFKQKIKISLIISPFPAVIIYQKRK